jgi:hypothetical protein
VPLSKNLTSQAQREDLEAMLRAAEARANPGVSPPPSSVGEDPLDELFRAIASYVAAPRRRKRNENP